MDFEVLSGAQLWPIGGRALGRLRELCWASQRYFISLEVDGPVENRTYSVVVGRKTKRERWGWLSLGSMDMISRDYAAALLVANGLVALLMTQPADAAAPVVRMIIHEFARSRGQLTLGGVCLLGR